MNPKCYIWLFVSYINKLQHAPVADTDWYCNIYKIQCSYFKTIIIIKTHWPQYHIVLWACYLSFKCNNVGLLKELLTEKKQPLENEYNIMRRTHWVFQTIQTSVGCCMARPKLSVSVKLCQNQNVIHLLNFYFWISLTFQWSFRADMFRITPANSRAQFDKLKRGRRKGHPHVSEIPVSIKILSRLGTSTHLQHPDIRRKDML